MESQSSVEQTTKAARQYELDKSVLHTPSLLACIYYALSIVAVGLPAWYYTCSLTRHSLPAIDSLLELTNKSSSHGGLQFTVDISIVTVGNVDTLVDVAQLREQLPTSGTCDRDSCRLKFSWRVRRPMDEEERIIRETLDKSSSLELDTIVTLESQLGRIHRRNAYGRLWMYIMPEEYHDKLCQRPHSYSITFERIVLVCPNYLLSTKDNPQPLVRLTMDAVNQIYADTIDTSRITHLMASELDLVVSVITERQPKLGKEIGKVDDKIELIHRVFTKNIRETFAELSGVVNIKLVTQYLFEAYEPQQIERSLLSLDTKTDSVRRFDVHKSRDLINTIHTRLSAPQTKQIYHLFILLPDEQQLPSPIVFHDTRSMLSNGPEHNQNLLVSSDLNSIIVWNSDKDFVLAFRALCRHLLGIKQNFPGGQAPTRGTFFTRWEMDSLLMALTVAKIEQSSASLESLIKLSDEVSNLVIEKQIATKMSDAFHLSLSASRSLADGNLSDAYRSSTRAFDLSESAFFDASLLKLLYFPQEQKYAIYLPLVLPLLFPLMASFNRFRVALAAYRRCRGHTTNAPIDT